MDFPATPPQALARAPEGLLKALGLEGGQDQVRLIGRSVFDYFVEMADARQVRQLSPRFAELAKLEARGVIVSAAGDQDCDVVSRCFFPAQGIDEDSATGSAHCTIGPHFASKFGRQRLVCHQASARGGLIRVRVEGQRVHLGGAARIVVRGELVE